MNAYYYIKEFLFSVILLRNRRPFNQPTPGAYVLPVGTAIQYRPPAETGPDCDVGLSSLQFELHAREYIRNITIRRDLVRHQRRHKCLFPSSTNIHMSHSHVLLRCDVSLQAARLQAIACRAAGCRFTHVRCSCQLQPCIAAHFHRSEYLFYPVRCDQQQLFSEIIIQPFQFFCLLC